MRDSVQRVQQNSVPFDIWRTAGTTEHMGGVYATQRLLGLSRAAPGQTVLDVGCGTGYTACLLAKEYQARVVAMDIGCGGVEGTRTRVIRQGVGSRVAMVQADALDLPYPSETFDVVVVESVLVFCDVAQAGAEMCRALKPGGVLGVNELTLLKPPPEDLVSLLQGTLGIHSFEESQWRALLEKAGFAEVSSQVQRINFWQQFASHIRVDGISGYVSALVRGLANSKISSTFISRKMLKAARQFMPFVGYGIYIGKKRQ